jgi:alkylated DNA repair protein alkB family protein 6
MPHEDGAAYEPVVATISLGAPIVLDLYDKRSPEDHEDEAAQEKDHSIQVKHRILQEPGSILVTTGEAYASLLHGISPIARDEDLRAETVINWDLLGDAKRFELTNGTSQRSTRISLTYRDVLKVSKVGLGMLGRR